MKKYVENRDRLLEWTRSQLTGMVTDKGRKLGIDLPGRVSQDDGDGETLKGMSPTDRYQVGVLYPVYDEGVDPASEIEDDEEINLADDLPNKSAETATKQRRYIPPSSVGFSFYITGDVVEFRVRCLAVIYELKRKDAEGRFTTHEWLRRPLTNPDGESYNFSLNNLKKTTSSPHKSYKSKDVLKGRGGIDVLCRPMKDGWIITISLFNNSEIKTEGTFASLSIDRAENSLFEVELNCFINSGTVGVYPRVDMAMLSNEEQEVELRYKDKHIYAIGHGAAVNWKKSDGDQNISVNEIWTDFLPAVEVPRVTADIGIEHSKILQFSYLACLNSKKGQVFDDLNNFIMDYAEWIRKQTSQVELVELDERPAANRIVERMKITLSRMKQGVICLRNDQHAMRSFAVANQAMLDQMMQNDYVHGKPKSNDEYFWRPFQLAFLLCTIESVINEDSDFRDMVDLIWFPTGGGKTEAYLGLIAFIITYRRLKHRKSGGGTTVLMRYTLRLLTSQQFIRATRLICALELIRRGTHELGDEPVTIGLWVGTAATPNTFEAAHRIISDKVRGENKAPMELVLERCPWCQSAFNPAYNYKVSPTSFSFRCTNQKCSLGATNDGIIPCNVVDEALYSAPPTLLIATIDKFARLAWEERANAFFGGNTSRPPELIIQDELHLIAGALGSVAGIYEAALDTIITQRGIHPKYIASTATIWMAEQQAKRLYGRKVAVFPPPGLSSDNSYFAKTVSPKEKPGRLYIGYLAPMLNRQRCMAPLAALLLIAPQVLFAEQENHLMDAWWTQVVYHGSLKGVGNSHNSFNIDVRECLRRYSQEARELEKAKMQNDENLNKDRFFERVIPKISQLTSNCSAEENARTFARLERSRDHEDHLDVILATNMVSVGLDVDRLALMIINGQPLTTAEYIQASSRVGRADVPGLVFANYYRDQARSLSHYENFRPYHESFYRFVEPSSITPYTYQARLRALHAALVIALRHSCDFLLSNSKAGSFNPNNDLVSTIINKLKLRCCQADSERAIDTQKHIDKLVDEWNSEAISCKMNNRQLNYQSPSNDNASNRLLYAHEEKIKGKWATLHSMRNVEHSALMKPL